MAKVSDFSTVRVSGPEEWKVIREAYAETYPVRPLLNRIDQLEDALLSLLPGLVIDLRYAEMDDDKDAMQSRIDTVRDCFTDPKPDQWVQDGKVFEEDAERCSNMGHKRYHMFGCTECGGKEQS